jgi:hypothetical protein
MPNGTSAADAFTAPTGNSTFNRLGGVDTAIFFAARDRRRFRHRTSGVRRYRGGAGLAFGIGPAFRNSCAPTEDLGDACRRIQTFCGNPTLAAFRLLTARVRGGCVSREVDARGSFLIR